jgi:serine/threonine protein kinase
MTRFVLTEKEILRKISHRFIQCLFYAFQTFEYLYLVFDFCPGGELRSVINQAAYNSDGEGPIVSEEHTRLYLAEVLISIEELHKNGIIHRDIKPENILIAADGHIKLSDFGLSKVGIFSENLTTTRLGGGQTYKIPEVLLNRSYGTSVDLYLLGLLVYEMLVGEPAFPCEYTDEAEVQEENIINGVYSVPE